MDVPLQDSTQYGRSTAKGERLWTPRQHKSEQTTVYQRFCQHNDATPLSPWALVPVRAPVTRSPLAWPAALYSFDRMHGGACGRLRPPRRYKEVEREGHTTRNAEIFTFLLHCHRHSRVSGDSFHQNTPRRTHACLTATQNRRSSRKMIPLCMCVHTISGGYRKA